MNSKFYLFFFHFDSDTTGLIPKMSLANNNHNEGAVGAATIPEQHSQASPPPSLPPTSTDISDLIIVIVQAQLRAAGSARIVTHRINSTRMTDNEQQQRRHSGRSRHLV